MSGLEHYKQLARQANAQGDQFTVGMIIVKRLEQLFGNNRQAAYRFYAQLEQTAPHPGTVECGCDD
jgi:hypothetical protein